MYKFLSTLLLLSSLSLAQSQNNTLNEYVKQGIKNNLAIQQNTLSLKSAQQSLKIAKGMFLPAAQFQTRYTMANGGRAIDLPIGDLMNRVYSTLNEMLEAQGQSGNFPQIENEKINFVLEKEFDARVSIVQPVYNRALHINNKIAKEQITMSKTELEKYKRELSFQIKEAYFSYLKTIQLLRLIERTNEVVIENKRVSKKLFENNMITSDAVLRANADVNRVKMLESEITTSNEMAKNYFNFLLNRDLNENILETNTNNENTEPQLDKLMSNAIENREELSLLNSQSQLLAYMANLSSAAMTPNLALAIDYGVQGEQFSSFSENDYVIGSVVLSWSIFNGNINRNKRQQAHINKQKSEIQKLEVANQIRLEVKQDFLKVQQQNQNLLTAESRNEESAEVYRIVEKRFREGEAALVELLDARNNMVEAESEMINTKYDLLISIARLEKSGNISLL